MANLIERKAQIEKYQEVAKAVLSAVCSKNGVYSEDGHKLIDLINEGISSDFLVELFQEAYLAGKEAGKDAIKKQIASL